MNKCVADVPIQREVQQACCSRWLAKDKHIRASRQAKGERYANSIES